MAEQVRRRDGADRATTDARGPRPRRLLRLLLRVVTPRSPAVLVMERDGRLVCERVGERSPG